MLYAVRIAFGLPRETHRFFIEEISKIPHPRVLLARRFVKFHENVQKSPKVNVRLLS